MEDFIKPVSTPMSGTAPLVPTTSTAFDRGYGAWDLIQQELETESFIGIAAADTGPDGIYDVKFDKEQAKQGLVGKMHPDFIDSLMDRAVSQEHLDALMPLWTEKSDRQYYSESQPFINSLGLGIGAEVTNLPVYWAAMLAAPELAAVASATWATRFIAAATGEAVATGAKDLFGEHDKDKYDYLFNSMFAGFFGSAIGREFKNTDTLIADEVKKQAGITAEVEKQILQNPQNKEQIVKEAYEKRNQEVMDRSLFDEIDEAIEYSTSNIMHKAITAARQDIAAMTSRSESPTMKAFSDSFFPDPTAKNLNKNASDLATTFERTKAVMFADLLKSFGKLERDFAELSKKNQDMMNNGNNGPADKKFSELYGTVQAMRSLGVQGELDELVEMAIKKNGYNTSKELSAIVKEGVNAAEKLVLKQHQLLKEAGMKKFGDDGIKPNPNYMHIVHDRGYITRLRSQGVSASQIATAVSNSMRKGLVAKGVEVDEELLKVIGYRFYNAMTESKIDAGKTFNGMLDDMLDDSSIDAITKNKINEMKNSTPYSKEKGLGKATETRTTLDYSHVETVKVKGKDVDINIFDIVSKDFKSSTNAYIRKMAGASVLEKTKWKQNIKPLTKEERAFMVEQSPEMLKVKKELEDIQNIKLQLIDAQRALDGLLDSLLTSKDKAALQKLIDDNQAIINDLISKIDTEPVIMKKLNDLRKQLVGEDKLKEQKLVADRTLSTTTDMADFISQMQKEINDKVEEGVYSAAKGKAEMVRINTVLKELQGIPTAQNPDGFMQQANRIFQNVNIGRLLTQTAFTMGGEIASVGMESGYKNMLKSFPQIKSVLNAYRTGSIDDKAMAEIQEFTGMFNEMYQSPRAYEQAHEYSPLGTSNTRPKMDWIESKSEAFAEFTLMVGGIKPITAATRAAYAQGVMKKMRGGAVGQGNDTVNYQKMMHEFGFSKETEEAIYTEIRKHDDGITMNFKDWDVETRNLLLDGVVRKADMVIQKKNIGDRMGWVLGDSDYLLEDTVGGKVVMSLKSFALTAFTKQAGRLAGRADMFAALTLISQLAIGSLLYTSKSALNYAGNQDKLDKALEPEQVMLSTIAMLPAASLFPQAIDTVSTTFTDKPIFGHSRNSGQITDQFSSLPAIDLMNQLLNVASIPVQGSKKGFDELSTYDPLLKITGAGGFIGAKTLVEASK